MIYKYFNKFNKIFYFTSLKNKTIMNTINTETYNKNNSNNNKTKMLYLLGPTASGKTKTSFYIANLLNIEIINTDAFALYKGKGIMTAKPSKDELFLVKHHLIDILEINETSFSINKYKDMFNNCINEEFIKYNNNVKDGNYKYPLIVGGTNYYVEMCFYEGLVSNALLNNNINGSSKIDFKKNKLEFELNVQNIIQNLSIKYELNINALSKINFNDIVNNENIDENYKEYLLYNLINQINKICSINILSLDCLTNVIKKFNYEDFIEFLFRSENNINYNIKDLDSLIKNNANFKNKDIILNISSIKNILDTNSIKHKNIKFKILNIVDKDYASTIHKNDIRKIENALIYFFKYYIKKSTDNKNKNKVKDLIIKNQNFLDNKYVVYLKTNKEVILSKITNRLKNMLEVEGGLIEIYKTIHYFLKINNNDINKLDFEKGILQAIGFKEFLPFILKLLEDKILNEMFFNIIIKDEVSNEINQFIINNKLECIYSQCFERLKISSFQYAKYQIKFIENRILKNIKKDNLLIIENSESEIQKNQINDFINLNFLSNKNYENNANYNILNNKLPNDYNYNMSSNLQNIQFPINCIYCNNKFILNTKEYYDHIQSKYHKSNIKRNKLK